MIEPGVPAWHLTTGEMLGVVLRVDACGFALVGGKWRPLAVLTRHRPSTKQNRHRRPNRSAAE